jgi:hypothetical protein
MPRIHFQHEARYRSAHRALGGRTPRAGSGRPSPEAGLRFSPMPEAAVRGWGSPAAGIRWPAPEASIGRFAPEAGAYRPAPEAAYRPGSPTASSRRFSPLT